MDDQIKDEIFNLNKILHKPKTVDPEVTKSSYFCACSICESQRKTQSPSQIQNKAKEDYANYEGQEQSFTWLLHQLGKASKDNTIKINIPETVVFRKSRPMFLLQQKQDRSLKLTSSQSKLKLTTLKKLICSASRVRKSEDYFGHRGSKIENYSKDVAIVKYMHRDYDNECEFIHPFYEEGAFRVMNDNEFGDLMAERSGSSMWKKICYMQGVVKCRQGMGETFVCTYYSHDANDAEAIIELQNAGKDENELFEQAVMNNIHRYAKFICRRIAYTLAVNSQLELLRIQPEFTLDDNGKIWLISAQRISVKKIELSDKGQEVIFKKVELRSAESKDRLNEELQAGHNEVKAPHQIRMLREMSKHYIDLKSKLGIDELFKQKPKDPKSNEVFSQLRPFSPYNIYDLIDPESLKKIESSQKKKHKRIRFTPRGLSRVSTEEKSRIVWSAQTKASVGSTRNIRTSSRFSQHLKSWITPRNTNSALSLF